MNSDIRAINELKLLSIDMINRAKSGSPGICMDMASIMYILFAKVLNVFPENPNFFNRDRVYLSSAHIAPLYYAMLHMAGYNVKKEDLMNFERCGGITPGLPELNTTPGIDGSTAFAGDGIGLAVGTALARRYINNLIRSDENKLNILTYGIYCFCSDADIFSGNALEAMEFAGEQKLERLVFLYDYNKIGADGDYHYFPPENIAKRFALMGFQTEVIKDNLSIREISRAISRAKECGKPALIIFQNKIGANSFHAGKSILHSGPLSFDDTENIRKTLNSILAPFEVSKDSQIYVQAQMKERTSKRYSKWLEHYNKLKARAGGQMLDVIKMLEQGKSDVSFLSENFKINDGYRESLLESNSKIMNIFAGKNPLFLGGSAGLASTTQTLLGEGDFQTASTPLMKNIFFGVHERSMGSILNGMALTGLRVFGSTKLCYADECKPSIRMTALMNLPVTYIFTHDSIYDSMDGPARIPCEQLNNLRSIPNLTVYRPADINEVMGSWEVILSSCKPSALVLTKNSTPKLPGSNSKEVSKGAYIIKKEKSRLDGIIIATGSEVISAMQIAFDLEKDGLDIRVVSMPSVELFLSMGDIYREEILPSVKTIVMEAGNDLVWYQFVHNKNCILSINDFAYSGVTLEVLQKMDYDYESLKLKVKEILL